MASVGKNFLDGADLVFEFPFGEKHRGDLFVGIGLLHALVNLELVAQAQRALDQFELPGFVHCESSVDEIRCSGNNGSMLKILSLVLALLSAPVASFAQDEAGWEEISNDDGIRVWSKDVEGSDLVAFRGEADIDAPISKVATVLRDTSRKTEWMANTREAKDVRIESELERVEYTVAATPWPLKDRDFVYRAHVSLDKVKKQVRVLIRSVEDSAMPVDGKRIRGEIIHAETLLTSLPGDQRTRIMMEMHADPKGGVPKWAVNLTQKSWPRTTLTNIRRQVQKPDVFEHAQLRVFLFEKSPSRAVALENQLPPSAN